MNPTDREKPVVILNVECLGFVEKKTDKFRARPNAAEFLLKLSRKYHLATVSSVKGMTIKSKLFGIHMLLFAAEEGDLQDCLLQHQLDNHNSFILDFLKNFPKGKTLGSSLNVKLPVPILGLFFNIVANFIILNFSFL